MELASAVFDQMQININTERTARDDGDHCHGAEHFKHKSSTKQRPADGTNVFSINCLLK